VKILSFGAGAIGTYIGGSLAHAGHEVVFLERPETAATLQSKGLQLVIDGQVIGLKEPPVVSSLADALQMGPYTVALFALKSYDTQTAVAEMAPFEAELPPILCLQNGVENEAVLADALGAKKVIAATVTSAIARSQTGQVELERLRGVGLDGNHLLAQELAQAMNAAGLNARLYVHPADMKWSKLLTNLPANASSAITGMTPAEIYQHPGLFKLEKAQMLEALKVMHSLHLQVVDLPGTPVRAMVFAVQRLPEKLARGVLTRGIGGGRGGKMPSFYLDLHSGRGQSEVAYLNGAIVRAGEQVGIPTPANRVLTETLMALVQQTEPLEQYAHQPERLIQRYQQTNSNSETDIDA